MEADKTQRNLLLSPLAGVIQQPEHSSRFGVRHDITINRKNEADYLYKILLPHEIRIRQECLIQLLFSDTWFLRPDHAGFTQGVWMNEANEEFLEGVFGYPARAQFHCFQHIAEHT